MAERGGIEPLTAVSLVFKTRVTTGGDYTFHEWCAWRDLNPPLYQILSLVPLPLGYKRMLVPEAGLEPAKSDF